MFKKLLLILLLLVPLTIRALPSVEYGNQLSWSPVTTTIEGVPITDLAGYKIYWRQSTVEVYDDSRSITINDPIVTSYMIINMGLPADGNYMVTLTAFNTAGEESDFSNEVNFTRKAGIYYRSLVTISAPAAPILVVE